MRKFSPIKEPVVASIEQWAQRSKDEKLAYRDLYNSVYGQLNTFSDMSAHGGSILEDLRTWEAMLQNKTLNPNTLDLIRSSLQFQHSLNIAFGRLATALSTTVCTKLDFYSKDPGKGEPRMKDDKEIFRLMQESEERFVAVFETYWKSYVEFFKQGYQLGVGIKNFFVKLHPEDPVFVEVPKAFGKDLSKIWEDETDMKVIIYILKYFEEYGYLDETVLKNNVPPDAVKAIIQALEKGMIPLTGSTEAMAHVLMHWINSLSDSIFTQSLQKEFLETANMVNLQAKKEKMGMLMGKLPKPNRVVLMAIIRGCVKIAREKSVGNLRYTQILLEKIADLAAALGPSLTRCTPEQVPLSHALVRYLVLNSELFFPLGCEEERVFVTEAMKLGRVAKLGPELAPPPSLVVPPLLSVSDTSSPKNMKIGDRNSSKSGPSYTSPPPSPFFLSANVPGTPDTPPLNRSVTENFTRGKRTSPGPSTTAATAASSPLSSSAPIPIIPPNPAQSPIATTPPPNSTSLVTIDEEGMFTVTTNTNNLNSSLRSASPTSAPTTPTMASRAGIGIGTRGQIGQLMSPTSLSASLSGSLSGSSGSSGSLSTSAPSSLTSSSSLDSIDLGAIIKLSTPPASPRYNDDQRLISSDETDNGEKEKENDKAPPEPVQKLARDVVGKIGQIQARATQSENFEEAFQQVLKLKIVVPEVENIKTQLQMGMDFDKSELAKARGDKLARVRTTVQIFAREIVYVMETVISIFDTSEIPAETKNAVGASLVRISAQLS